MKFGVSSSPGSLLLCMSYLGSREVQPPPLEWPYTGAARLDLSKGGVSYMSC